MDLDAHQGRPPAAPLAWLLGSAEPAARWVALVHHEGRAHDDPLVVSARTPVALQRRIEESDPYFRMLHTQWGEGLRQVVGQLPNPDWT